MNQEIKITRVKPVCKKDCPGRTVGCHGKCEKYKAFREECDIDLQKRSQQKKDEHDMYTATSEALKRLGHGRGF